MFLCCFLIVISSEVRYLVLLESVFFSVLRIFLSCYLARLHTAQTNSCKFGRYRILIYYLLWWSLCRFLFRIVFLLGSIWGKKRFTPDLSECALNMSIDFTRNKIISFPPLCIFTCVIVKKHRLRISRYGRCRSE